MQTTNDINCSRDMCRRLHIELLSMRADIAEHFLRKEEWEEWLKHYGSSCPIPEGYTADEWMTEPLKNGKKDN